MAVLSDGPPSVFRRVDVDPVIDTKGRFLGWRVLSVNDPDWAAGDVHPDDVITLVNGSDVKNPNDFFDVFQSLAFAPALVLSIRRNGQDLEVRYPIDDDPASPNLPHPTMATSATREVNRPSGKATASVPDRAPDSDGASATRPSDLPAAPADQAPSTKPSSKRPASKKLGGK